MEDRGEEWEEDGVQKREVEADKVHKRGVVMGLSTVEKVVGRINTSERREGNHGIRWAT
jgi:hypothetical protein